MTVSAEQECGRTNKHDHKRYFCRHVDLCDKTKNIFQMGSDKHSLTRMNTSMCALLSALTLLSINSGRFVIVANRHEKKWATMGVPKPKQLLFNKMTSYHRNLLTWFVLFVHKLKSPLHGGTIYCYGLIIMLNIFDTFDEPIKNK